MEGAVVAEAQNKAKTAPQNSNDNLIDRSDSTKKKNHVFGREPEEAELEEPARRTSGGQRGWAGQRGRTANRTSAGSGTWGPCQ